LQIAPQVRYLTSVRLRSEVAHRGDDKLLADRYQQFIHQACVRDAATDFGPGTNTNGQIYQRDAWTICETTLATARPSGGGQDRQYLRCLLGGAEKKRRGPESGARKQDFVVNAASPARGWNRLSKSEKNWGRPPGEFGGGRGDLRMSGHRCRFRDSSHLRYRLCATKIHRRSNCTWIGIDDEFSLSAHCTVAEAFSARAALGGWKIDNRGDALRCGDRLSRTGAGDHCQDQDRAFSSEESARNCDGRLRGFDRCALGRDRCRASEFDSGRPANCRKSQLLTGRDSCCPASGRILLKRRQNLGLSSSSRKGFMWGRP
jgi:hypothetical protein